MMEVDLCGIKLKNPVITASGTFGFGHEYKDFVDLDRLGGISTKGLTLYAKEGNKGIRLHETPAGLMNSIGLQNPSVESFIKYGLPIMKNYDTEIIANIGGNNLDQYIEAVKLIDKTDINIIELNISCPNVKEGGMAFGIQCESAEIVVSEVRKHTDKILMVKLSPNAENIVEMAKAVEKAGADALSLVNTFNALAIDIHRREPVFDNKTAGLSGPAIKPIALRMVNEVYHAVDIPIVGLGGISNYEDALEFIMAGATAIQVGTANFVNPNVSMEIIEGIEDFMLRENIKSLDEIRGII